jgi:hypothetical protein
MDVINHAVQTLMASVGSLPLPLIALGSALIISWLSSAAISALAIFNLGDFSERMQSYAPDLRTIGLLTSIALLVIELTSNRHFFL